MKITNLNRSAFLAICGWLSVCLSGWQIIFIGPLCKGIKADFLLSHPYPSMRGPSLCTLYLSTLAWDLIFYCNQHSEAEWCPRLLELVVVELRKIIWPSVNQRAYLSWVRLSLSHNQVWFKTCCPVNGILDLFCSQGSNSRSQGCALLLPQSKRQTTLFKIIEVGVVHVVQTV